MADAIEQTYFHICNVFRMTNVTQSNGSMKQERTQIYSGVKCAFSKGARPALNSITDTKYHNGADLNRIESRDILFMNPSYIIQQGDMVIISIQGRTITAFTAMPFLYPSHQQMEVQVESYA